MTRRRTGRMDKRGTVQRWSESGQDSYGQPTGSWVDVGNYWFSVEASGGEEDTIARQQHAQASHTLVTRHTTAIDAGMRIVIEGGQTYDIKSAVDPDGRRRWLEIETVYHA